MDEAWEIIGPDTTLVDLVKLAAGHLAANDLGAFEFDIPGMAADGTALVLHFECSLQRTGAA